MRKPADEEFIKVLRETITFVRPMQSVVQRGVYAYNEQQPTRSMRIPADALDEINEASALLGMSRSAFMVWCSQFAAKDILRQHEEFTRSKRG